MFWKSWQKSKGVLHVFAHITRLTHLETHDCQKLAMHNLDMSKMGQINVHLPDKRSENSQKPQFSSLSKVNKCLYTETSHFRNVSQSLWIPNPIFLTTSASGGIDPQSIWPYHIFYHWLEVALCLCFFLV